MCNEVSVSQINFFKTLWYTFLENPLLLAVWTQIVCVFEQHFQKICTLKFSGRSFYICAMVLCALDVMQIFMQVFKTAKAYTAKNNYYCDVTVVNLLTSVSDI
jgi:hypothetical protein